jgi:hypothetical protein
MVKALWCRETPGQPRGGFATLDPGREQGVARILGVLRVTVARISPYGLLREGRL